MTNDEKKKLPPCYAHLCFCNHILTLDFNFIITFMRKVKFRAWDKTLKEMLIPPTLTGHTDGSFSFSTEADKNPVLMLCTGLKDKHNVDIFEGDIVKMFDPQKKLLTTEQVIWNQELAGWYLKHEKEKFYDIPLTFGKGDLEILGNIYEQPELNK